MTRPMLLVMLALLTLVAVPVALACYYITSMLPQLLRARDMVGG